VFVIGAKDIDQRCTLKKKLFDRKLISFLWRKVYIL